MTSFTNQTKHTSSWTNQDKHSATFTMQAKSLAPTFPVPGAYYGFGAFTHIGTGGGGPITWTNQDKH